MGDPGGDAQLELLRRGVRLPLLLLWLRALLVVLVLRNL